MTLPKEHVSLTKEEKARLQGVARGIWDGELGMEVMQMVSEEGQDSIPRSHVLEIVLDADRFHQEVRRQLPGCLAQIEAMTYDQLKRLIRPAFPFARYGM